MLFIRGLAGWWACATSKPWHCVLLWRKSWGFWFVSLEWRGSRTCAATLLSRWSSSSWNTPKMSSRSQLGTCAAQSRSTMKSWSARKQSPKSLCRGHPRVLNSKSLKVAHRFQPWFHWRKQHPGYSAVIAPTSTHRTSIYCVHRCMCPPTDNGDHVSQHIGHTACSAWSWEVVPNGRPYST